MMGKEEATATDDSHPHQLIHENPNVLSLWNHYPPISTITMASGWTDEKTLAFTAAVQKVVEENPILSGHLFRNDKNGLCVRLGSFQKDLKKFVQVVDLSETLAPNSPTNLQNINDKINYINQHVAPLADPAADARPRTVDEEVKGKSPLFHVKLFLLPDQYVCYNVSVSHAISDVATHYMLLEQISSKMNPDKSSSVDTKDTTTKLKWDNPEHAKNPFYPENFTRRDLSRLCGPVSIMGIIVAFCSHAFRKPRFHALCRNKIETKKKELLRSDENKFLSSNDIVSAAICSLTQSSDIMLLYKDWRGRSNDIAKHDGGNFNRVCPFLVPDGKDPNYIRKIVNNNQESGIAPNGVSLVSILRGRFGSMANWAGSTKFIEGVKTECHVPCKSMISGCPVDLCWIFHLNDECLGVYENFYARDGGGMMDQIRFDG